MTLVWPLVCMVGMILTQTAPDYKLEKMVLLSAPATCRVSVWSAAELSFPDLLFSAEH